MKDEDRPRRMEKIEEMLSNPESKPLGMETLRIEMQSMNYESLKPYAASNRIWKGVVTVLCETRDLDEVWAFIMSIGKG